MRTRASWTFMVLAGCLLAEVGRACSVPVFRYALERWAPDPYQAIVLHRGPLSEAEEGWLKSLTEAAAQGRANLTAQAVDLAEASEERWHRLREFVAEQPLPCVVLLYPAGSPVSGPAWTGSLTEQTAERLLDSPARQTLVDRLVAGQTAVWLLLEIGDPDKDEAAARFLEQRLKHLEQTLELPELAKEDLESGLLSIPKEQLRIAFSIVRISRANAAEAVLARLLLGSEDDLHGLKEPMAFPVFGRGRALYAVVGAGINEENVDEAASFLTGPCSCQVKELNPGVDLLLAADWERQVRASFVVDHELPPLSGLRGFAEPEAEEGQALSEPGLASPGSAVVEADTNAVSAALNLPGRAEQRSEPIAGAGVKVWVGILVVTAAGLLAVGAFTVILLKYRG